MRLIIPLFVCGLLCGQTSIADLEKQAGEHHRLGRSADALKLYKEIVAREPGRVQSLLRLGEIYDSSFLPREALYYFRNVLELEPGNAEALYRFGRAVESRAEKLAAFRKYLTVGLGRPQVERREVEDQVRLLEALGDRPVFVPSDAARSYRMELRWPRDLEYASHVPSLYIKAPGGEPLRLLIGTATDGLWLSPNAARRLGAKPLSPARLNTRGSLVEKRGEYMLIDSLHLGDLEYRNCVAFVASENAYYADGVIGTNVFRDFVIQILYPGARLRLDPLVKGDALVASLFVVRARREGHLLFLPAAAEPGVSALFVLNTLVPDLLFESKAIPATWEKSSLFTLNSISGWSCSGGQDMLHPGSISYVRSKWKGPARSCAMPAITGRTAFRVQGVIGDALLNQHSLVLDYSRGLIGLFPPGQPLPIQ